MRLVYLHIWRGTLCDAFEIDAIQESLVERGFSLKLKIPATINDFRIAHGEFTVFGEKPTELPDYVFEKDLTQYIGRFGLPDKRSKEEIEYDLEFFGIPKNSRSNNRKFSRTDNTILLGSASSIDLIGLVTQCGFILHDSQYDILTKLGAGYLAVYDSKIFQAYSAEELLETLVDNGYNIHDDLRIEKINKQFISSQKRKIRIKNIPITLPPYVFVAQIMTTGIIANISNNRTYWITIGAPSESELDRLIEKSGLGKISTETSDNTSKSQRRPISERSKIFVWNRDGGRCTLCGSQINLEFDHIIPISMGGSSTERNLQLLCEKCNRQKGAKISGQAQ